MLSITPSFYILGLVEISDEVRRVLLQQLSLSSFVFQSVDKTKVKGGRGTRFEKADAFQHFYFLFFTRGALPRLRG